MSVQILPLQDFQNVVANGIAVCDLGSNLNGYTIQRIVMGLGGTTFTKSMMSSIQLKLNGKVVVDTSGSRMDSRQQYKGISASASFITLDFMEIRAKTKLAMEAGALDTTLGVKQARLEVAIAGATAPTLVGWAEVDTPQLSPEAQPTRPLIARTHKATQVIGAAGEFVLNVPHLDPNGGGSIYKRIHIFSANMTAVRQERNGIKEFQLTQAALAYNQAEYQNTAQSNVFTLDFTNDHFFEGRVLDTRPGAKTQNAQIYGTFSAGETITIETEELLPLDAY